MTVQWFVKGGRVKYIGPFSSSHLEKIAGHHKAQPKLEICRARIGRPDESTQQPLSITGLLSDPAVLDSPPSGSESISSGSSSGPPLREIGRPVAMRTGQVRLIILIAIGLGLFLLFGVLGVRWYFSEGQREREQTYDNLVAKATAYYDANDLPNAKSAIETALAISGVRDQEKAITLRNNILSAQKFINQRAISLISEGRDRLATGDIAGARTVAEKVLDFGNTDSHHLAEQLMRDVEKTERMSLHEQWGAVYPRIKPSIVRIKRGESSVAGGISGGYGTGFIIGENIVVTNHHVIRSAKEVEVIYGNDTSEKLREYLYRNAATDIAILRCRDIPRPAKPLEIEPKLPVLLEKVVAIGHPKGFVNTITDGSVAAIRTSEFLNKRYGRPMFMGTWIQFSAPISGGNSGGPLLTITGKLLGMNTFIHLEGANDINFAISSRDILKAIEKAKHRKARPF